VCLAFRVYHNVRVFGMVGASGGGVEEGEEGKAV
jgi:hypothetical protein